MESEYSPSVQEQNTGIKTNNIFIIIIVVLVLLIIFTVLAYLIRNQNFSNVGINTNTRAIAASLPREPTTVYERSGTITAISQTYITIQTRVRTNSYQAVNAYEYRTLTVNFDLSTNFTKKSVSEFTQTGIIPASESSSRSELHVGDTVNVKASVNIKDLDTFTAIQIEKIY